VSSYLSINHTFPEHDTEEFAKKLLGEYDIEAVLQRLDRLTMDELHLAAAQAMEVVYGLFNNMKVVMEGTETLLGMPFTVSKIPFPYRWKGIHR
jgi:hypothetical protein